MWPLHSCVLLGATPQVAAHVDARGAIYRFKLHGDVHVNMYYTKAGQHGLLHNALIIS
jgi:hypothetical protein